MGINSEIFGKILEKGRIKFFNLCEYGLYFKVECV